MRFIVTGGAGFIGSVVVKQLAGLPECTDIGILDRQSSEHLPGGVSPLSIEDACKHGMSFDCDTLIHLAAQPGVGESIIDPAKTYDQNVTVTQMLLNAAAESDCKRVVFISSSSVYGNAMAAMQGESCPTMPRSPYAASKVMGEALVHTWASLTNRTAIILRPFNVYGPTQPDRGTVITRFAKALVSGDSVTIEGDGEQARDFTYVDDVAEAIVRASLVGIAGDMLGRAVTMNVCTGVSTSINKLVELMAPQQKVFKHYGAKRIGDVASTCGINHIARTILDWEPQTDIETGVKLVLDAWRSKL